MKKYQIIWAERDGKSREIIGNAAGKAPCDVTAVARSCGYEDIYVYNPHCSNKLISVLIRLYRLKRALSCCEKDSTILIQYPCFNEAVFQFAKYFFPNRNYITVVHDLNSIRVNGKISKAEVSALSVFKKIIVHSPEMKDCLSDSLLSGKDYYILDCFPYLTDSVCQQSKSLNEVCFAGNIDKSVFLKEFIPHVHNIKLKLYGRMENKLPLSANVEYCGMFNPNDISSLSGSWGLVWDGNSVETCSGTWGKYLKIIAPHKFSLYIAAGIPVIVWEKSAMARLVRKYNIGITIESLTELETKIGDVFSYDEIKENIQHYREDIINAVLLTNIMKYV